MKTTPKTEEELKTTILLKDGDYDVVVHSATDEKSKAGNDMVKLVEDVWEGEEHIATIFDYLLDSMPAKLRHACDTFGLLSEYEAGVVEARMFVGKQGRAKITVKHDKTGQYSDQNTIKDYICRPAKPLHGKDIDSDSPF